jgi:hypothetical protein
LANNSAQRPAIELAMQWNRKRYRAPTHYYMTAALTHAFKALSR